MIETHLGVEVKDIDPANNPLYPLPADYLELTSEGQRQARVNACRLWTITSGTRTDRARRWIAAYDLFDKYYLYPDFKNHFDPLFYDEPPLPMGAMHRVMLDMWANYNRTIWMGPRGAAKTTFTKKGIMCRMVSMPKYSFVYCTSSGSNATMFGGSTRDAIYNNERIAADWGREYGSRLEPSRGELSKSDSFFYLGNRSFLKSISASSKQRGLRPREYHLDDPEYDEDESTDPERLRADLERLIFKIAYPMILRGGSSIHWRGTFLSRKHFAWYALDTRKTPDGETVAVDPRFNKWARLVVPVLDYDGDGNPVSAWPHRWPVNEEERSRLNLDPTTPTIEDIREDLGEPVFQSEMMCLPGSGDGKFFEVDESPEGRHAWWLEEVDDEFHENPRNSDAWFCYMDESEVKRIRLKDFLRVAKMAITVDTAFTSTKTSDRRCCTLLAFHGPHLFALDMWSDQSNDHELMYHSFRIADRWKVPVIYVEYVKNSISLYNTYRQVVRLAAADHGGVLMGFNHVPNVRKLKVGQMPKTGKIAGLKYRFDHGLIHLPFYLRTKQAPWQRCISQIIGFNPLLKDGGLDKDDEIDTIAMSMFLQTSKERLIAEESIEDEVIEDNVTEMILKGVKKSPNTGLHPAMGMDPSLLGRDAYAKLLSEALRPKKKKPMKGIT